MKKILVLLILVLLLASCSTVPVTGRSQLNLLPASTLLSMSYSQYDQFLKENKLSSDKKKSDLIFNIGNNIQKAVEKYFAEKGWSERLKNYKWEYKLVDNPQVNAWCMPGGKVVFYTGIFTIADNEDALATVMGHEIAHAVAEHGNERMSQGLLTQLGGIALAKAIESKPAETQALFMTAFGLGAQVGVLLPYSRLHENEADYLGLIFMAMAGYNPEKAVDFWQKMAEKNKGQAPPEFLSTHPSDETRIANLKKILPEVMTYYKKK